MFLKVDDQKTDHDPHNVTSACTDDVVAAFALALEERAFLGCNGWDERFAQPLGVPLGLLETRPDGSLRRRFASGTSVTWDPTQPAGRMGRISWAQGK